MGNTFPSMEILPEEDDLSDSLLGQEREVAPIALHMPLRAYVLLPGVTWRPCTDTIDVWICFLLEGPNSPSSLTWLSCHGSFLVPDMLVNCPICDCWLIAKTVLKIKELAKL